jgi:Fe-S oxidoreductase
VDTQQSVVTGLSPYDPAKVEAAAQALDLCLACKGCKAECPSGVDMAKLKFAFQAEYYKTHRRQLRDYIFGYFHIAAGMASGIAPVSNALMEISIVKNLFTRMFGITEKRPFPKFSRSWAKLPASDHKEKKKVIFLSDAFARFIEPETEQAAFDILSKCGYDIQVLPVLGAGASFLSKGFIDQARQHAIKVLDALMQIDPAQELRIVGIEPPEVYCFKHDYVDLVPQREDEIHRHVDNLWLLDEFLLRSEEFSNLRVDNEARLFEADNNFSRKIRFHPHCHQRAEGLSVDGLPTGTNATLELLRSCGYVVELMDTGCCGMAGTFGYEAEHYDISMQVGELKLFPQLRALAREDTKEAKNIQMGEVLASGAACRMQIRQGTGVNAIHPILWIAGLLNEGAANGEK